MAHARLKSSEERALMIAEHDFLAIS